MKRRDEVAVGILMTIALSVLIIGTIWLLRGGLSSGYPLYTRFKWGQNLKQGQPVLLAGVTVGYVGDVQLRQDGFLDVLMRINDEYHIPKSSTAQVRAVGFFGDVAVALNPLAPSSNFFAPGDTVPAGPPEANVDQLMSRGDSIAVSLNAITSAMNRELVQAGALRDIRRTLASTAALATQLQSIAAQQNENLSRTFEAYRHAAGAVDSAKIDSTLANLRSTSANVQRMSAALDSSTVKINGILARLDRGEGTAGKLLRDTLLYSDLRHATGSLDSLITDLKKNPRKYINLRIF